MSLHPDFPVVQGQHPLTAEWTITLDAPFNRRIEDGDLVLWRPGLTAWIAIWHNDEGASIPERLQDLRAHMADGAYDLSEEQVGDTLLYAYRLAEAAAEGEAGAQAPTDDDGDAPAAVPGLYCYAFAQDSHVQMAVYVDDEADIAVARALHRSLAQAAG